MDADTRLVLAALIDHLIYDNPDTFSLAKAIELNNLIPVSVTGSWISLGVDVPRSGKSTQGYSPGVGNVSLKSSDDRFKWQSDGKSGIRAGQWKVVRMKRTLLHVLLREEFISIKQMMAVDTDEGTEAQLYYRRGQPIKMKIMKNFDLPFGRRLIVGRMVPWKTPSLP